VLKDLKPTIVSFGTRRDTFWYEYYLCFAHNQRTTRRLTVHSSCLKKQGCDHSDGDGHDSERTIMASSCDSDTYTYTCETVLRYSSTCYGIMKSNSPWISGFRDDVACPLGEDGDAPQEPDESCYEPVCLPVRDGISGIYSFRLKENDDCIIGFSEPCVSSGNSCEPLAPNCCHGNCQTSTYTCPWKWPGQLQSTWY